jgi:hypothetical protein
MEKLNEDRPKLLALLPQGWEAKAKELGKLRTTRGERAVSRNEHDFQRCLMLAVPIMVI